MKDLEKRWQKYTRNRELTVPASISLDARAIIFRMEQREHSCATLKRIQKGNSSTHQGISTVVMNVTKQTPLPYEASIPEITNRVFISTERKKISVIMADEYPPKRFLPLIYITQKHKFHYGWSLGGILLEDKASPDISLNRPHHRIKLYNICLIRASRDVMSQTFSWEKEHKIDARVRILDHQPIGIEFSQT